MSQSEEELVNIKLLVAYDGTNFHGLSPNPGVRTVVGEIMNLLEPYLGSFPQIVMSGRTDAGVHAWGQVLNFNVSSDKADLQRIQRIINNSLSPEVVVRQICLESAEFSSRFDAVRRIYRYTVFNNPTANPFKSNTSWWVGRTINIANMNIAASHLVGTHDFSSFCRKPKNTLGPTDPSLVRKVEKALWSSENDQDLIFEISGSAFCHQMVRSIVGFLVAVGLSKREPDEIQNVLLAKDRSFAEQLAPPNGLVLWRVEYE